MYFKLNRKTVVKAMMENGLYIVDHVSSPYKETAFPCIDHNMNYSNKQELAIPTSSGHGWVSIKDLFIRQRKLTATTRPPPHHRLTYYSIFKSFTEKICEKYELTGIFQAGSLVPSSRWDITNIY
jgi:hypothetical protein